MNKNSTQRQAILSVLRDTTSHPTADCIYEEVRKVIPNISKGTVYRNLKILRDTGVISELNLSGTVSRFESRLANHYHFRCGRCGLVSDVDITVNKELDLQAANRSGHKILYHQLEFRGLCKECNNR